MRVPTKSLDWYDPRYLLVGPIVCPLLGTFILLSFSIFNFLGKAKKESNLMSDKGKNNNNSNNKKDKQQDMKQYINIYI